MQKLLENGSVVFYLKENRSMCFTWLGDPWDVLYDKKPWSLDARQTHQMHLTSLLTSRAEEFEYMHSNKEPAWCPTYFQAIYCIVRFEPEHLLRLIRTCGQTVMEDTEYSSTFPFEIHFKINSYRWLLQYVRRRHTKQSQCVTCAEEESTEGNHLRIHSWWIFSFFLLSVSWQSSAEGGYEAIWHSKLSNYSCLSASFFTLAWGPSYL